MFAIWTIVFCIKYIVQKVKLNTHTILGVVISNIFLPFGLSICVSEFIIQPQTNGVFYNFSIQFAYGLKIIIFFSITLFALIGVSKMLIKTSVEYAAVKEFNLICSFLFILIPIFTIRNQYMITANIIANYKFSFSSFFIVDAMLSYGKSSISSELYPILIVSTILKISLTFVLIGLLLNARTRKRRIILSILLFFAFVFHLVPNILINYFFNMYKQNVTTIYLTPSTEFDINLSNFNFSANTPYIFATVIYLTVLILNLISLLFPRIKSEECIENDLVTL